MSNVKLLLIEIITLLRIIHLPKIILLLPFIDLKVVSVPNLQLLDIFASIMSASLGQLKLDCYTRMAAESSHGVVTRYHQGLL